MIPSPVGLKTRDNNRRALTKYICDGWTETALQLYADLCAQYLYGRVKEWVMIKGGVKTDQSLKGREKSFLYVNSPLFTKV